METNVALYNEFLENFFKARSSLIKIEPILNSADFIEMYRSIQAMRMTVELHTGHIFLMSDYWYEEVCERRKIINNLNEIS